MRDQNRHRINGRIRAKEIRVIGPDGDQLGIMSVPDALEEAKKAELDLVEVSPNAKPPVCRILDYGKFLYEQDKKAKKSKKKQHTVQIKGVRFSSKIGEHDYQFKLKHIQKFIEKGNKVKVWVFFRGREITHQEIGKEILDRIAQDVKDIAAVEQSGAMEGRMMTMLLAPGKK